MTGCLPADCAWIRRRQKWCGLVQDSRLAASTLVTFPCCQQPSSLLSLHVTLVSFSMQSWQCLLMSLHSCRSGFLQLRQLRPFTRSLTTEAAKTLVQAFISCRLDYCNSLLYGVTDNVTRRVQSLQNAAARLITGARRRDHITPVLCQLHWLPVRRWVEFGAPGIVRSNAYLPGWWHPSCLPRQPTIPSFFLWKHVHTTALETEALVLRIWNCLPRGRWTLDIGYKHFKALLKTCVSTWPRRFVTFYISVLEIPLLTYLCTMLAKPHKKCRAATQELENRAVRF